MEARIKIDIECPNCMVTMSRLPQNYYVQCLSPECVNFQVLYELPTLTLNKVGESVDINEPIEDEGRLVEVIPE